MVCLPCNHDCLMPDVEKCRRSADRFEGQHGNDIADTNQEPPRTSSDSLCASSPPSPDLLKLRMSLAPCRPITIGPSETHPNKRTSPDYPHLAPCVVQGPSDQSEDDLIVQQSLPSARQKLKPFRTLNAYHY